MAQGFSSTGELVESDSADCAYLLTELNGRPFLSIATQERSSSMYGFGTLAVWCIRRSNFSWIPLLSSVPDPGTEEKRQLKEKLLGERESIMAHLEDEMGITDFSADSYELVAELFARLYPAYGHFEDKLHFLSDNFYSFEPDWEFRSYHTAPDFRTLIEEAFGCYRKDLARAVAQCSGSTIALLSRFKGSITTEQMVEMLNRSVGVSLGDWSFVGTSLDSSLEDLTQFNRLSPALRFRLLEDFWALLQDREEDGMLLSSLIADTLNMLGSIPDSELKRFRSDRSWDQVHSRTVALASDEKVTSLDPISIPLELDRLDGLSLQDGTGLKLLRTPFEYLQAGSKSGLDNCMGKAGYYTKARNGESYSLVGHLHRELTLGIEVSFRGGRWSVLQLNGPGNSFLENRRALEEEILAVLNGGSAGTAPEVQSRIVLRAPAEEQLDLEQKVQDLQRLFAQIEPFEAHGIRRLEEFPVD